MKPKKKTLAHKILVSCLWLSAFVVITLLLGPRLYQVDEQVFEKTESQAAGSNCDPDEDEDCIPLLIPSQLSFLINNGDRCTTSNQVTLSIDGRDVSEIILSNDTSFVGSNWEAFSRQMTKPWTLSERDGDKNVYVIYKSESENNSSILHDTILLDTQENCGHEVEEITQEEVEEVSENEDESTESNVDEEPDLDAYFTPPPSGFNDPLPSDLYYQENSRYAKEVLDN